jgi:hypothetical protein
MFERMGQQATGGNERLPYDTNLCVQTSNQAGLELFFKSIELVLTRSANLPCKPSKTLSTPFTL